MSLTRRLSLLAGSSFAAASLALLAPGAALAQTCSPATVTGSGAAADTVNCSAGTFPTGITYSSEGALTVNMVANGAVVNSTVTANGVILTGNGADSVTFDSDIGSLTGGTTTGGPVIEVTTNSGAIAISTGAVSGTSATVTHGIKALSTGGGAISVTSIGSVSGSNSTSGDTAIEAISTGGNGSVSVVQLALPNGQTGSITGRRYGVRAQASGSGALTITTAAGPSANGGAAAIAAIDATTGTGLMTITGNGAGGGGTGLRINAGGDATITGAYSSSSATNWGADMTVAAGGMVTLSGSVSNSSSSAVTASRAMRGAGAGQYAVNITGGLTGGIDFSANTGGLALTVGSIRGWNTEQTSLFSAGNDTLTVPTGGAVYVSQDRDAAPVPAQTVLNFGAGTDVYSNAGLLLIGPRGGTSQVNPSLLTLEGLETFHNSGLIIMGARANQVGNVNGSLPAGLDTGDLRTDDVLRMTGGTFSGSGDSRVVLDALLDRSQSNCVDRDSTTGALAAADCLDLRGASTAGLTMLKIGDLTESLRGANVEIVLVDVAGAGTSSGDHFAIAADTPNYSDRFGGVIDRGDFFYALIYDEDAQQHKLKALPGGVSKFAALAPVVQGVWRAATDPVFDRQNDSRDEAQAGYGGGVWLRATGELAERDVVQTTGAYGTTFVLDDSYEADTVAVNVGADLLWADTEASSYAVGLTVGYARTDIAYDQSPDTGEFSGMSGGVYAAYAAGGFFLDAAVTGVGLSMDFDIPALDIRPAGAVVTTNAWAVGGRVEAGWRLPLGAAAFVEPLASAAYTRASFDDMPMRSSGDPTYPSNVVEFDDAVSLRGAVGARLGADTAFSGLNVSARLTGRVWNEFEGDSAIVVRSAGADLPLTDAFTGTFSDIAASLSVADEAGLFSGFLQVGGKFGDSYQATSLSGGLSFRW